MIFDALYDSILNKRVIIMNTNETTHFYSMRSDVCEIFFPYRLNIAAKGQTKFKLPTNIDFAKLQKENKLQIIVKLNGVLHFAKVAESFDGSFQLNYIIENNIFEWANKKITLLPEDILTIQPTITKLPTPKTTKPKLIPGGYLNMQQTAEKLDYTYRSWMGAHKRPGMPPYIKIGKRCFYKYDDLATWMNSFEKITP